MHVQARQVPVEQELGLDQERVHVVGWNAIFDVRRDRQHIRQRLPVQMQQRIDRGLVALLDRRRRIALDHALVAEILDAAAVPVRDRHGGCPAPTSPCAVKARRHRDERHHVVGEMRDLAVGLAIAHRRAVGPLRRVHQDHVLVAERQPLVDARRSVALHAPPLCLAVTAFGDELAHGRDALYARREAAEAGDAGMAEFGLELGRQRQRDVDAVGRQEAGGAIGPFEQHHRFVRQVVEPELVELGRAREPVEVGMYQRKCRQRRSSASSVKVGLGTSMLSSPAR